MDIGKLEWLIRGKKERERDRDVTPRVMKPRERKRKKTSDRDKKVRHNELDYEYTAQNCETLIMRIPLDRKSSRLSSYQRLSHRASSYSKLTTTQRSVFPSSNLPPEKWLSKLFCCNKCKRFAIAQLWLVRLNWPSKLFEAIYIECAMRETHWKREKWNLDSPLLLVSSLPSYSTSVSKWFGKLPWSFCRSLFLHWLAFFGFNVPVAFTFDIIWSIPSKGSLLPLVLLLLLWLNGFLSMSCCERLLFLRPAFVFFEFVEQQMPLVIDDLLLSMLPARKWEVKNVSSLII